jgi:hypothetical protein
MEKYSISRMLALAGAALLLGAASGNAVSNDEFARIAEAADRLAASGKPLLMPAR